MSCFFKSISILALLGFSYSASATVITLNTPFPGRGWFNDVGLHTATNDNTFTGTVDPNPLGSSGRGLNSFFTWDLSSITGNVNSATLRIGMDNYFSTDSSETIEIYDVSASFEALTADYSQNDPTGIAIHNDLQAGAQYGGFSAISATSIYTVDLTAALLDINSAVGGVFAIGLHNATDSGVRLDGVRFDQSPRVHELILDVGAASIPEPSTLTLMALGLAGIGYTARKKKTA